MVAVKRAIKVLTDQKCSRGEIIVNSQSRKTSERWRTPHRSKEVLSYYCRIVAAIPNSETSRHANLEVVRLRMAVGLRPPPGTSKPQLSSSEDRQVRFAAVHQHSVAAKG